MGNNSYEKSKRYDWDSILESMIKNYRQAILSYQKCQINNLNMQNSLHVPSIVNPAE